MKHSLPLTLKYCFTTEQLLASYCNLDCFEIQPKDKLRPKLSDNEFGSTTLSDGHCWENNISGLQLRTFRVKNSHQEWAAGRSGHRL